jgi:hypothetical protein
VQGTLRPTFDATVQGTLRLAFYTTVQGTLRPVIHRGARSLATHIQPLPGAEGVGAKRMKMTFSD